MILIISYALFVGSSYVQVDAIPATNKTSRAADTKQIIYAGNHCKNSPSFATKKESTGCLPAKDPTESQCCNVFVDSQDYPVFGTCFSHTCEPCKVYGIKCGLPSTPNTKHEVNRLCPVTSESPMELGCLRSTYPTTCIKSGGSVVCKTPTGAAPNKSEYNSACCTENCDKETQTCD